MSTLLVSEFDVMDEAMAQDGVLETFADIKRTLDIPFVPNIHRALAGSPHAMVGTWQALKNVALTSELPMSLTAMILYSVSAANDCTYCSAVHRVTCKSIGIDETTLSNLANNITELAPERVQKVVAFAVKCATAAQDLDASDYAAVRDAGLTEKELVEVVAIAALANYLDTIADAFKLEVDTVFKDLLGEA